MIGLAAAAILLTPTAAPADGPKSPLSVVVHASGTQDVSYAIEVHNTTDRQVPDAVITQQLPPGLDYVAATPPPHRTGRRHLTWTLAIPAHGTARITSTGAADHHLGARPLAQAAMVCAGQDAGPQACTTTSSGTLKRETLTRWEGGALAFGGVGVAAAGLGGARVWRRRRAAGAVGRAGVEG